MIENYEGILLGIGIAVFFWLPILGLFYTYFTMGHLIMFHIKLAFNILGGFVSWGIKGGTESYIISWTDMNGKEKHIKIGQDNEG